MKHLIVAMLLALSLFGTLSAAPDTKLLAVYNTQLRAENEVRGSTSEARGHAQIKVYDDGTIEWKAMIFNPAEETFFAGHIHVGAAGDEGGVVQGLFTGPDTTAERLDVRGSAINPTLASALLANPSNYYVNFHTRANAPGAIRGQLP